MMDTFLTNAPCLYFSSTDDGMLTAVNESLCFHLGYRREELIGQKQDLFFTLATRIFQQTHLFPLLQIQGHANEIYISLKTKDKEELPVLINAERKTVDGRAETGYVGILVLNRKKFEDELVAAKKAAEVALHENTALLQAKESLQQHAALLDQQMFLVSRQNAELMQFNHVVTHELQEPLRKLLVFTNMLLEDERIGPVEKQVKKIKSVSDQMREILSGLQQYVWLTETPPAYTPVDLKMEINTLVTELKLQNSSASINVFIEDDLLIEADRKQLHFLLQEMLANALRFQKENERLQLSIAATVLKQNQFKTIPERYRYTEFVKLQVSDNGIGFDATYKEQVFELYRRLHPVSGRGIGLPLCKKVVENHNGSITIESEKGKGTTVTIMLPLNAPTTGTEAPQFVNKAYDR